MEPIEWTLEQLKSTSLFKKIEFLEETLNFLDVIYWLNFDSFFCHAKIQKKKFFLLFLSFLIELRDFGQFFSIRLSLKSCPGVLQLSKNKKNWRKSGPNVLIKW